MENPKVHQQGVKIMTPLKEGKKVSLYTARRYKTNRYSGYLWENVIVEAFAFSFIIPLL